MTMHRIFKRAHLIIACFALTFGLMACSSKGNDAGQAPESGPSGSSSSSSSSSTSSSSSSSSNSSSGASASPNPANPPLTSGGVAGDVIVINGISVPPDPGSASKSTLAGVDANFNGVRDEVERELAAYFGKVPATHAAALEFARKLQSPLSIPITTSEDATASVTNELMAFECLALALNNRDNALAAAELIASRSYNTKNRVAEHTGVYDLSGMSELPEIGVPSCN
jgi:hypothetical protein